MRRLLLFSVLVASCALLLAAPSSAHLMAPQAQEACTAAVDRQIAADLRAGGGPKATEVGPANCDHFWFRIGAIGHDHSGGP